ncbi:MAG: alpha/beta hydrolase [Acidimicrobiales bacterium]|nr:alpha/beta hydrolase [Acidimicrobiales bacterium]
MSEATYDEFSMFRDNCSDVGLPWPGEPVVERVALEVEPGRSVSALRWGTEPAEIVFVHGGAQNAHTWDTVLLAMGRPALAVDLAGHGRSDWRPKQDYAPQLMAADVLAQMQAFAPAPQVVVGMSLGGLTALCATAKVATAADPDPALTIPQLVLLDVSPGVDHAKAEPIITFVDGPQYFDSFADILARTMEHNKTRTESSLRRGILHNAKELEDGRWTWRYDPMRDWKRPDDSSAEDAGSAPAPSGPSGPNFADLWTMVDNVEVPITLLQGGAWSVVDDADIAEFRRRKPDLVVEKIADAGHSIQGDQPLALAERLGQLLG